MNVDYQCCYAELVQRGGSSTEAVLSAWRQKPGYGEVVSFVENFDHRALFQLSSEDVLGALRATEHALGNVEAAEQLPEIENFTCPFALQHLFHRLIERTGELPTWQRFWKWLNRQARGKWIDQIEPLARHLRGIHGSSRVDKAIRWRLGKFYYSAVREVDLLVSLREAGVGIKYHILADVLLRCDFWYEDTVVCTYFPNGRYRHGEEGRKAPAVDFLGAANPPFHILHFEVKRQGFGRAWLVSTQSKEALLRALRAPRGGARK